MTCGLRRHLVCKYLVPSVNEFWFCRLSVHGRISTDSTNTLSSESCSCYLPPTSEISSLTRLADEITCYTTLLLRRSAVSRASSQAAMNMTCVSEDVSIYKSSFLDPKGHAACSQFSHRLILPFFSSIQLLFI